MTILIFLAVLLVAVILAIFLNRLVRCSWLVGFLFFSIALLVAIILSNITLVILAIIVGVVGFLAAFLDCTFNSCRFFKDNECIKCHNPYEVNTTSGDEVLTIVNSSGDVVARINGSSISCTSTNSSGCGCCGNRVNELTTLADTTNNGRTTEYEYNCRGYRRR